MKNSLLLEIKCPRKKAGLCIWLKVPSRPLYISLSRPSQELTYPLTAIKCLGPFTEPTLWYRGDEEFQN